MGGAAKLGDITVVGITLPHEQTRDFDGQDASAEAGINPPLSPSLDPRLHKPGVTGSSPVAATVGDDLFFSKQSVNLTVTRGEAMVSYHADRQSLGSSDIRDLISRPIVYRSSGSTLHDRADSGALTRGTLVHSMLESGGLEQFKSLSRLIPDEHLTKGGIVSAAKGTTTWVEEREPSVLWVTPVDWRFLEVVWRELRANRAARDLYESISEVEVSIRWTRPCGQMVRCRPDAITSDGQVIDFKTTRHADPVREWHKSVGDYLYHVSDALYSEGTALAGLREPTKPMVYVLISTSYDCTVQCVTLPQAVRDEGRRLLDAALVERTARKSFGMTDPDGYGSIAELPVPAWVIGKWRHYR